MPDASTPNAGNAPLVKLGHTVGKNHGTDPLKKLRGEPMKPTEITYGSKSK